METSDGGTGYSLGKPFAENLGMALLHDEHPVGPEKVAFIDPDTGLR